MVVVVNGVFLKSSPVVGRTSLGQTIESFGDEVLVRGKARLWLKAPGELLLLMMYIYTHVCVYIYIYLFIYLFRMCIYICVYCAYNVHMYNIISI